MDTFYRVPLSTAEATAAVAALRALCAVLQTEGVVSDIPPEILESAAARIEAETPEFLHPAAERMRAAFAAILRTTNFAGGASDLPSDCEPASVRQILERAWRTTGVAEIEYFVAKRNEWTIRRVVISDLREGGNGWYVAGECQLRRDHRMFRLDQIRAARVVDTRAHGGDPDDLPDPFSDEGNA